ncbi:MAG: DNRLRE domain-containing protein [Caloramator sp.]|nr:DNRLRE domain-containing protein [Caloramator sp.]
MGEVLFLADKSLTITNERPDENINTDIISCGFNGNFIYRSFLNFDISSLPYNAFITSAILQLFLIDDYFKCFSKNLYVYMLKEDFGDFTTYNQQPKFYSDYIRTNISYKKYGLINVNITNFVQRWMSGETINKGLLLRCEENKKSLVAFGSKNNSQYSAIPKLYINFIKPKIYDEGKFIDVKEEVFDLNFINEGYSRSFDVSRMIIGSFIIKNTGFRDVDVCVDVSIDGITWIRDTEKRICISQSDILVPKYYGKYYRIYTYTNGEGSVNVKFIYQVYK